MKRGRSSECGGCGVEEGLFLHHVRHRATYRRLCTDCLLKSHQGFFCPFCFRVLEDSPLPREHVTCVKCPSISHLSCVPPSHARSPPSFLCPACSSPTFSFFSRPLPSIETLEADGESTAHPNHLASSMATASAHATPFLLRDSVGPLMAAAKIAAISMRRAEDFARDESEKRVDEALFARRRAKEALERLFNMESLEMPDRDSARQKADQQLIYEGGGSTDPRSDPGGHAHHLTATSPSTPTRDRDGVVAKLMLPPPPRS